MYCDICKKKIDIRGLAGHKAIVHEGFKLYEYRTKSDCNLCDKVNVVISSHMNMAHNPKADEWRRKGFGMSKPGTSRALLGNKHAVGYGSKHGYRDDIGFYVRSCWEANVARIWKEQGYLFGKDYFYEPTRFLLSNGVMYVPDFFFIDDELYYEIKGRDNNMSKLKRKLVVNEYDISLYLIGPEEYRILQRENASMIINWEY